MASDTPTASVSAVTASSESLSVDPFRLAVGLLWNNRRMLAALYLLLIAPRMLLTIIAPQTASMLFALRLGERLVELAVGAVILRSSFELLGGRPFVPPIGSLLLYFAIGLLSWLTLLCPSSIFPFEILWTLGSPGGVGPALFMALPAAFVWYVHYFWSFSVLLPSLNLPLRISLSRFFVQQDRALPIKTALGPIALCFLPSLLAVAPFPDGRSLGLSLVADFFSGIEWLLSSYLVVGFGFALLPETLWNKLGLEPYRSSRFSTLELKGPAWLPRMLKPKVACQLIGLCSLLWAANLARLAQLAPSPSLKVTRVWYDERAALRVDLEASDPAYHFRGFRPLQFRITDKDGSVVWAPLPEGAAVNGAPQDARVFFPLSADVVSLQLAFRDYRAEIAGLPADAPKPAAWDHYTLWYGAVKIAELSPEKAAGANPK